MRDVGRPQLSRAATPCRPHPSPVAHGGRSPYRRGMDRLSFLLTGLAGALAATTWGHENWPDLKPGLGI
jgi:hypothetical protein